MKGEVFQIKASRDDTPGLRKILRWKKPLTSETVKELRQQIEEAMNQGKNEILLDCADMAFVDSEGLELLLKADERLREKGGALKLAALNSLFTEILVATRLMNVLRVHGDIHEAMRSRS